VKSPKRKMYEEQWSALRRIKPSLWQPSDSCKVVSLQHALSPVVQILNRVFDRRIVLIASFVTAAGKSNSYELTGLSLFVTAHLGVVK